MLSTLPYMGFISIMGKDADKFLQGQLTCDINSLTETNSLLGAYCSQQGRVQATFRIFKINGHFCLYLPAEIIPAVITLLQRYAVFSKVTVIDSSSEIIAIGLAGEAITSILPSHHFLLPNAANEVIQTKDLWLAKLPGPGPRYLLIGNKQAIDRIQPSLAVQTSSNDQAWELYDIAQGVPIIFQSTMDQYTPHVLNYDQLGGISFSKGCYIGQEIIARTHYRGQVKQHLHRAIITATDTILPIPGDKITDQSGFPIGTIINASRHHDSVIEVLAVLPETAVQTGQIYLTNAQLGILPLLYQASRDTA